eukprot:scaffold33937_cov30-Tisochrysis_lutea.AAC.1
MPVEEVGRPLPDLKDKIATSPDIDRRDAVAPLARKEHAVTRPQRDTLGGGCVWARGKHRFAPDALILVAQPDAQRYQRSSVAHVFRSDGASCGCRREDGRAVIGACKGRCPRATWGCRVGFAAVVGDAPQTCTPPNEKTPSRRVRPVDGRDQLGHHTINCPTGADIRALNTIAGFV